MNKLSSYCIVGLMLSAGLCLACSNNKQSKDGRTDTYSSGTISFVSDESFSPIVEEEREVFQHDYPAATVTPIYTSESDAINQLLDGKTCLAFTARDFRPAELEGIKANKILPQSIKIGYDALALIVNKGSRDTLISKQEFAGILNGSITRWEQLGNAKGKGTITVVFDNPKSSTVHWVEDSLLGGKAIANKNVVAVNKTAEVITYVEKHPGTIGIIGNNWLNDKRDSTNLTFNRNIRVMEVSQVHPATPASGRKPYQYYIYTDEYPLVRTIYALVADPRQGLPWGFAHFCESPKGQLIVMKSGLLPYRGDINIRDVNVTQ